MEGGSDILVRNRHRHDAASKLQIIAVLVACLGPMSFGFVLGYTSPTHKQMKDEKILTDNEASWFSALVAIGAIVGGPVAGQMVGWCGRKLTIMLGAIPFVVGWMLIAYQKGLWMLLVGRFLTGFATGWTSLCVPLYIAEVASKHLRGTLGAFNQLSVTIGILLAYGLGIPLSWSWLAVSGAVIPTLMAVLMVVMPDSPRWLLRQKRMIDSRTSLKRLRVKSSDADEEYDEMLQHMTDDDQPFSLGQFRQPDLYHPLLISVGLMVFQQFSGVNAIMFYDAPILEKAGFCEPKTAAVIVGAVQVVVTFLGSLLMEKAGRRVLLILAGILMTLSSGVFGLYFFLTKHLGIDITGWLSVVCLVVFVSAFGIGWGPIPWIIMSEVFPARATGTASGISIFTNWLGVFLVTFFYTTLDHSLTSYGAWWLFTGLNLLGVVFVFIFVPETRGHTLEQIHTSFRSTAGRSSDQTDEEEALINHANIS
ncbi:solute carrier family 2, facilitated glucose transporter member 8 [Lingula anatina]|uniref:Solute carrier family 2, facilitated glucose transporter member 8 n=1 Tax=Lingula anatina TaxID=7574 RepID=A0A1S3JGS0_LINAN|nr:solute carrier family 2, facilitated glucose transporter member 8 [Lingula anatina]|eukprot:XP_013409558.1 solute carrier family 2, facilitated glucose transporter member 8 [Lingula anatina]